MGFEEEKTTKNVVFRQSGGYMQNDASHIKAYQSFAYTPLKSSTLN